MAEEKTAVDLYDADHGTYADQAEGLPEDVALPSGSIPKAPDPNPFKMGPMNPGGRGEE